MAFASSLELLLRFRHDRAAGLITVTKRMHIRTSLGIVLVGLWLLASPTTRAVAQQQLFKPCGNVGEDTDFSNALTPEIPWPAWADLLDLHWSRDEIQSGAFFSPAAAMQAIGWSVQGATAAPENRVMVMPYPQYDPELQATGEQLQRYEAAGVYYRVNDWAQSIPLFDRVAGDKNNPYRAAAAYSAARATLNLGRYDEAMKRIFALVSDPSLKEFHLAAYHLIGTRANQSGAPELIAARYSEIEHLFIAPPAELCRDALARDILKTAADDFYFHYLRSAFPDDHVYINRERRQILDAMAGQDKFFDLIRAIAAPTPYDGASGWLTAESKAAAAFGSNDDAAIALALKDGEAITAHARDRWRQTKNPLWGYALAKRTASVDDLPLIQDMLDRVHALPDSPAVRYASAALQRHFVKHYARILLMDGKIDQAVAFLHRNWIQSSFPISVHVSDWRDRYPFPSAAHDGSDYALLNGGIRLLLEHFDLEGARRWAKDAGAILTAAIIDDDLRPLLASSYEELINRAVPGDGRGILVAAPPYEPIPRPIMDLLPRDRLVFLATHLKLSKSDRRALLAAAWLRVYMLDSWQRSMDLLGPLRDAYPELATDIDDIEGAWLGRTKRNLLTRMILRTPGFDLRPSWVRAGLPGDPFYRHPNSFEQPYQNAENIFAIDAYDPSDGNWWCPVDVDQVKIDMVETFFSEPVRPQGILFTDPLLPRKPYGDDNDAYRQAMLKLADKIIAWHPLLRDADLSELGKLAQIENGPRLLSENAVQWAKSSNWFTRTLGLDKHLPETLHLAVRSTRYGCRRQGGHGEYSRAAYQQLRALYPHSEWTKQTPYWFDKPGR